MTTRKEHSLNLDWRDHNSFLKYWEETLNGDEYNIINKKKL